MKKLIYLAIAIGFLFFLTLNLFSQTNETSNFTKGCPDVDMDGYEDASCGGTDCDDSDPSVHPGAIELPGNGIDENCDGSDSCICYADLDGDGFGDMNVIVPSLDCDCDDPGEAYSGDDCDDSNHDVHPGAIEIVDDGVDNDCSGDCLCWLDADDDGYRPDAISTTISLDLDCSDYGEAESGDPINDCDDTDPNVHPGAIEIVDDGVDNDCSGDCLCWLDADDDGYRPDAISTTISLDLDCSDYGEAESGDPTNDCDDSDASVYPGAMEICGDDIDNDCDGLPDDFDCDCDPLLGTPCDGADSDFCLEGVYECDPLGILICSDNTGNNEEICNGIDDNCDGTIDEGCLIDADGDGYSEDNDCDDNDPEINPGAVEVFYDGIDQDCDGYNDFDMDYDGFVHIAFSTESGGTAPDTGDCDDTDPLIYPGATEIPEDGIDQDCNGYDAVYCFADADGDSYGDPDNMIVSYDGNCDDIGESYNDMDCDDFNSNINPDEIEIPEDEIDQDCNGFDAVYCFVDADGDTYGDPDNMIVSYAGNCDDIGESYNDMDCDDLDSDINPDATEIWYDDIDQNCDGLNDFDQDLDGFVHIDYPLGVGGSATGTGDCNDLDSDINPDATEIWYDDIDQNCDGLNDFDQDLDGFVHIDHPLGVGGSATGTGDCNDLDSDINPDVDEICDGIDNNCDTEEDEGFFVEISYSSNDYCFNDEIQLPSIEGEQGGSFTSIPEGLVLDPETGELGIENSLSGTYTITYSALTPCDLTSDFELSINSVDVSVTDNSPTLTANAVAESYQWIDCSDNSIIDGENYQDFLVTETGAYAVIVSQTSCVDTSECIDVVIIELLPNCFNHNMKVYPNPTTGKVNVEFDKYYSDAKIILTNVAGQVVDVQGYISVDKVVVDIEEKPGMYFLEIIIDGDSANYKIIKK